MNLLINLYRIACDTYFFCHTHYFMKLAYYLLYIVLMEDDYSMANSIKHTQDHIHGLDKSHRFTPIQYCIDIFYKLSTIYSGNCRTRRFNQEEEIMVGYESSWAGVSKNTKFR